MAYFDEDDIERTFRCLSRYLNNNNISETTMKNIASQLKKYFANGSFESEKNFDRKADILVGKMQNKYRTSSVIILKNKNEFFDIYMFNSKVEFALVNLVSSEAFEDTLRRNPVNGYVIDSVSAEDILIFLKAYYIYRKEPKASQTSLNPVLEYNYESFEMASIKEKFDENNLGQKVPLEFIILYDKEALPYSLGYLDNYKSEYLDARTGERNAYFSTIISDVRKDRFLGSSLTRIK